MEKYNLIIVILFIVKIYNSCYELQLLPKSSMCICNNHGDCKGLIMEQEVLKNFCCCNCHDSSYKLIRNSIASNKIDSPGNSGTNQNMDY